MDEDQTTAEQLIQNASALNDNLILQVARALRLARAAGIPKVEAKWEPIEMETTAPSIVVDPEPVVPEKPKAKFEPPRGKPKKR